MEWSDGHHGTDADNFCHLSACPACSHAFWIDDAERLEKVAKPTERDRAQGAAIMAATGWATGVRVPFDESLLPDHGEPFAMPATNQQLISALESGVPDIGRERYLRKVLWHRGNHAQRGITMAADDTIPDNVLADNLLWLLSSFETMPSDDRDVVIEAELLRELGRFSESICRIEMAYLSGSPRAKVIHARAAENDATVCVVREEALPVIYK